MRTATIELYRFEELDDDAKERARQWWRESVDYDWQHESQQSIEAFCDYWGVTLRDWEISTWRGYDYRHNATAATFQGVTLADVEKMRDAMPTGYCLDAVLWHAFVDAFIGTGDGLHAFDHALDCGFSSWKQDMEWQESNEQIDECLTINQYEFTADGRLA